MRVSSTWWMALLVLAAACGDDGGGTLDGGAMEDLGFDAGPACETDADCDDGLFCNGTETCSEAGRCLLGAAPDCDDGIECTIDECDEALDACGSVAPDEDGDGVGAMSCADGEGTPLGRDCDDTDARRFPGNVEQCDAEDLDEDCDPTTFGNVDLDGDGFLDAACCNGDVCGTDCDDLRADVRPGSVEACDRIDNDCDGSFDEGVAVMGFVDADRDGWGDSTMPMEACPGAVGFVASDRGDDCDDADPAVNPGQVEICDEVDNDCNDLVDDDPSIVPWYADVDGDGFGDPADSVDSCEPISGRVLLDTDCDDTDPARHPGSAETCNGVDDDCNGLKDFEIAPGDFEDDDGDGIVDIACGPPRGVDCDDRNPASGPGTREICDGRDNDCDGNVDEGAMDAQFFFDGDGDGYGTSSDPERPVLRGCAPAPGYVAAGGDCDDSDPARAPGAAEACNATDDDCDGAVDEGGVSVCGCPSGTADCDMDDVCEVDLGSDADNCGACGTSCAAAETRTAICLGGSCLITRCNDGFDDCDGNPANGCETDLTSLSDCEECGNTCDASAPNVAAVSCTPSGCAITSCDPGFGDCNADPRDGCERDLDQPDDCGGCGVRCESGGFFGNCVSGQCVFDCGDPNRADCDGGTNGCETFLGEPSNCGGCGTSCSGGASCQPDSFGGFSCQLSCADNTADCDGMAGNGCEVTTTTAACGCGGAVENCEARFGPDAVAACVSRGAGRAECELRGCMAGSVLCGDRCADFDNDPEHCGSCFNNCGLGTCNLGSCDCSTVPGTSFCMGFGCVDTMSDFENCGGCGVRCSSGETCESGTCATSCPIGQADCGAGCIDTQTDPSNCGACGITCPTPGMNQVRASRCDFGSCQFDCDPGFADCDGDPMNGCEVNLDTDPGNCGVCNTSCGAGGVCALGACDGLVQSTSGAQHTCAVRGGGAVLCWGADMAGQVGDDLTTSAFVANPAPVVGLPTPVDGLEVSAGLQHSCALLVAPSGPEVWCWGDNSLGQLGCGGGCTGSGPQRVALPGTVQPLELTSGEDHTCALVLDTMAMARHVYCWGANDSGQIGADSAATSFAAPAMVVASTGSSTPLSAQRVVAGGRFTCSVPETLSIGPVQLSCWGDDGFGQLGNGAAGSSSAPVPTQSFGTLFDPNDPIALGLGGQHACAAVEGELFCWGSDMSSEHGAGPVDAPTQVFPGGSVERIFGYAMRTCVQMVDRRVRCRGDNTDSELISSLSPGIVSSWTSLPEVDGAERQNVGPAAAHQCVINSSRELFCWGDDSRAQIGQGVSSTSRPVTRVRP